MSWDLDGGFSTREPVRTPRLSIRCVYPPGTPLEPTEVTFGLSPRSAIGSVRNRVLGALTAN